MVYFLRDKNNKNFFEVEVWNNKEGFNLSSHIYAFNYCSHLLELKENKEEFEVAKWLHCVEFLEEFKGWFWEVFVQQNFERNIISDEKKAREAIKNRLRTIADILNLSIIED